MRAGIASVLLVALGLVVAVASAQPRRRICVVRFVRTAEPTEAEPARTRVRVAVERPSGPIVDRDLGVFAGPCVEDTGGLESLAIVTCGAGDAERRELTIRQRGLRIDVDEHRVEDGGARRLVRRHVITRARPGWTIVPRCAETADDPHACPP